MVVLPSASIKQKSYSRQHHMLNRLTNMICCKVNVLFEHIQVVAHVSKITVPKLFKRVPFTYKYHIMWTLPQSERCALCHCNVNTSAAEPRQTRVLTSAALCQKPAWQRSMRERATVQNCGRFSFLISMKYSDFFFLFKNNQVNK